MVYGQLVTVVTDGDVAVKRRLVSVENGVCFVCKDEEFEATLRDQREPVCIGFKQEDVLEAQCEIMKPDKGQFDAVLSRMLAKPPQKTAEIRGGKKAQAKPKPFRESEG